MLGNWIRGPKGSAGVVVFVHGLFAQGPHIWEHANGQSWPKLLCLQAYIDDLGIYTTSYPSPQKAETFDPNETAKALAHQLQQDGLWHCQELFFVCHGMGGLIVRKLLIDHEPLLQNHRIGLLMLDASPQGGADIQELPELAGFLNHEPGAIAPKETHNPWLQDLNDGFMAILNRHHANLSGLELLAGLPLARPKKTASKNPPQILAPTAYFGVPAVLDFCDPITLAQPENRNAPQFQRLLGFIKTFQRKWSGGLTQSVTQQTLIDPSLIWATRPTAPDANTDPNLAEPNGANQLWNENELPAHGNASPFSRLPYHPEVCFIGRELELLELRRALGPLNGHDSAQVVALTGSSGVGKSQLAQEFVQRYAQFYAGGIFWLDFSLPDQITQEIAKSGFQMRLYYPHEGRPLKEQVARVLRSWENDPHPRLLIFDQCEAEWLFHEWAPRSGFNQILITSRSQDWHHSPLLREVRLTGLDPKQGSLLLQTMLPDLDLNVGESLSQALEGSPLALHLAGAFLAHYQDDPATYAAKLPKEPILHASLAKDPTKSPLYRDDSLIGRVFARTFTRLNKKDPVDNYVRLILLYGSLFAPNKPLDVEDLLLSLPVLSPSFERLDISEIMAFEGNDKEHSYAGLHKLNKLGLLEAKDSFGFLHPCIRDYCLMTHPAITKDRAMARIVRSSISILHINQMKEEPEDLGRYFVHLRYLAEQLLESESVSALEICSWVGRHLNGKRAWEEAERYCLRELELAEKVKERQKPNLARALNNMAQMLKRTNRVKEAKILMEQALEMNERFYGRSNTGILNSLGYMAEFHEELKNYGEAETFLRRAIAITEKWKGSKHHMVARQLDVLANLMEKTGRYPEAAALKREVLEINKGALGADNPNLAVDFNGLAQILEKLEQLDEAVACRKQGLAIYETAYGYKHPILVKKLVELVDLLIKKQNTKEAEKLLRRALGTSEGIHGPEHPEVAFLLLSLGQLLHSTLQMKNAEAILLRAFDLYHTNLGPTHETTERVKTLLIEAMMVLNRSQVEIQQALQPGIAAL